MLKQKVQKSLAEKDIELSDRVLEEITYAISTVRKQASWDQHVVIDHRYDRKTVTTYAGPVELKRGSKPRLNSGALAIAPGSLPDKVLLLRDYESGKDIRLVEMRDGNYYAVLWDEQKKLKAERVKLKVRKVRRLVDELVREAEAEGENEESLEWTKIRGILDQVESEV